MSRVRSRTITHVLPRAVAVALTVVLAAVAVAWGALGAGQGDERRLDAAAALAPSQAPAAETAGPAASPSDTTDATADPGEPGTTASPPAEEAPTSLEPAERPGEELDPDLSIDERGFGRPGTYPDGVKVAITAIDQDSIEGMGAGSTSGPVTIFTVRVDNGSADRLDLSSVVLTAAYGEGDALLAYPTYDVPTHDLFGVVRPGGSARGVYAFAIPAAERGAVTLHVDLDGTRVPAVFEGSTRP